MRYWFLIACAALASAAAYYYGEKDEYDRKVDKVVKMLAHPDPAVKREGLDLLASCLVEEKYLITTVAGILNFSFSNSHRITPRLFQASSRRSS
jgi:hypothetical protein